MLTVYKIYFFTALSYQIVRALFAFDLPLDRIYQLNAKAPTMTIIIAITSATTVDIFPCVILL